MSTAISLSEAALTLLSLHLNGGSLQVGIKDPQSLPGATVEQTREAYRELSEAGLMIPLHTFAWGRDSHYRMTEAGVAFATSSNRGPSPAGSPLPRAR